MPAHPISWTVKRNCSASPTQLAAVFASIVGVSFVFGVAFATQGLWLILPFVGIEMIAVAIAFICYGRRAADFERITLSPHQFCIDRVEGSRLLHWEFPAYATRVEVEESGTGWMNRVRVWIVSRGERVEVGRHLPADRRGALAREMRAALRGAAVA